MPSASHRRRAAVAALFATAASTFAAGIAFAGAPITVWDYHIPRATQNLRDAGLILSAHNQHRRAARLVPLAFDPDLARLALGYANVMVQRKYIGHYTPEGQGPPERFRQLRRSYRYTAENIAFDANASAAATTLWNDPSHRDNIMGSQYRRIGIAAVRTPQGELVVEDFSD